MQNINLSGPIWTNQTDFESVVANYNSYVSDFHIKSVESFEMTSENCPQLVLSQAE